MANKRIRELDTMAIGSGGTAASSVFLAVDPNSGTTSKVSLEDAVAGTAALSAGSGGGAVGIPAIAHSAGAYHTAGTGLTIPNLFATNTSVFGFISFPGRGVAMAEVSISKTKGNNSVFIGNNSDGQAKARVYQKYSGDPRSGVASGAQMFVNNLGKNSGGVTATVAFFDNGFFFGPHSQAGRGGSGPHGTFGYQLMYWVG